MSFETASPAAITQLLSDLESGKQGSADRLAEAVHAKLQAIAQRELRSRYGAGADALTIEPGVLADDAVMKVLDGKGSFENRRLFFGYATKIMVRALIDHHRHRSALKRGGDTPSITLTRIGDERATVDVEALPPLLEELQALDQRKAEVVQLRVFWGMTVPEVSTVLDISPSTVDREWRFAHRWLARRLKPSESEDDQAGATS